MTDPDNTPAPVFGALDGFVGEAIEQLIELRPHNPFPWAPDEVVEVPGVGPKPFRQCTWDDLLAMVPVLEADPIMAMRHRRWIDDMVVIEIDSLEFG